MDVRKLRPIGYGNQALGQDVARVRNAVAGDRGKGQKILAHDSSMAKCRLTGGRCTSQSRR